MPLLLVTPYRRTVTSSPPDTFVPSLIVMNIAPQPAQFKKQAQFVEGVARLQIAVQPTLFKKQAQFVSSGIDLNIAVKGRRK